jgi:hypothetical protein
MYHRPLTNTSSLKIAAAYSTSTVTASTNTQTTTTKAFHSHGLYKHSHGLDTVFDDQFIQIFEKFPFQSLDMNVHVPLFKLKFCF